MTIETMAAIADFTAGSGVPPPEKLWLIHMGSGDTAWCSHPSEDDEPSVPYVRADVTSPPAKAPTMDAVEAVALRDELRVIVAPYLRVGALALGADCVIAEAVISVIAREVADAIAAYRPLIAAECAKVARGFDAPHLDGVGERIAAAIKETIR